MYSPGTCKPKFQFKTMRKAGDEKVTVVAYRGMKDSRCFRKDAQPAMKSQQSFKLIINMSNDVRLFECNDYNIFMLGSPFEDAQIALVKQYGSRKCLGCNG
jgi:hypothetical protein